MKISDIYSEKKSLSFEIFPPKKTEDLENIDETLAVLCECDPDFISVTFGAGGSSNCNRTIELAKKIKNQYHVEPVVHLTCLHYDKKEIDEFARVLTEEGIQNVLALRGDRNPDIPEKEDFKHASDLIRYLKLTSSGGSLRLTGDIRSRIRKNWSRLERLILVIKPVWHKQSRIKLRINLRTKKSFKIPY